jgi:hypothetical protein
VCAAAIVSAQQPVAKCSSSAADVQGMIEKAKNERKSDQPNFIQPILQAAPYNVNLEYRVQGIDTNPNIHDVEAEIVYVVDGGGVLTIGGKLKDERRTPSRRLRAGWSLCPCMCRGAVRLINLPLGEVERRGASGPGSTTGCAEAEARMSPATNMSRIYGPISKSGRKNRAKSCQIVLARSFEQ